MVDESASRAHPWPLARCWASASGFWQSPAAWQVWLLCLLAIAIVVAQLVSQYRLNYWNRDFFDALEQRNEAALARGILLFFPLVALATALAISSVWVRMTIQRNWRFILTRHLLVSWLANRHYRALGHSMARIVDQMQAEAAFRATANLVRESGEGILPRDIENEERHELWLGLRSVIEQWRRLCWQLMRITFVTDANLLLAPVIGLLLCVPKYPAGDMTLGEVTQAAAAFAPCRAL
jgi:ABC-type uncharacterized transport system fused permease/ATPase subunit